MEPLHLRAESEDERPLGGVQPGDGQQVVPGPGQAGDEDQRLGVFWRRNSPGLLVAQSGDPGLHTARDLVTSLREGALIYLGTSMESSIKTFLHPTSHIKSPKTIF